MTKLYKIIQSVILLILIIFIFSGCKVMNPSVMFNEGSNYQYADFEKEKVEYQIRPFDKIDIRIYTNDGIQLIDMESSNPSNRRQNVDPYLVEHDGMVKVPTLGRVQIAGLTIKQAEEKLEEMYSKYYQKPFVLLTITNKRIIVFTAGSTKGSVLNIEDEKFTLIEALARAGGIDDFSKAYKIKLLRGNLDNPQVYMFNISSIEEMKKANMVLQPNDIIYVDKRAKYTTRTLNEIMPYITLINTFALLYIAIKSL